MTTSFRNKIFDNQAAFDGVAESEAYVREMYGLDSSLTGEALQEAAHAVQEQRNKEWRERNGTE